MNVGYRNPPKSSQFRKGQSGNAKGRPRQRARPLSRSNLFRKVASEEVAIEVDGLKVVMSRWEAYLRQIQTMALNKNTSAARLLQQIRKQFPGKPAQGNRIIYLISEADKRL